MEYRTKFQYISCYGLSPAAGGTSGHLSAISIHLMLRFIFQSLTAYPVSQEFQYISCYGLSFCNFTQFFRHVLFQYISCYGLSPCCIGKNQLKYISIHLMLRFIGEEYKLPENIKEFQYISCYGLSCNQVDSFIAEYHFNTSHVTVYQKATLY